MIRAVLFDLDGVIRHFDPGYTLEIERRHGVSVGTLASAAFAQPLIADVTEGRITRADWVRRIGVLAGSDDAAAEWGAQPFSVDDDVLALADGFRSVGLATAVLTNGTDSLAAEMSRCGLAGRFDAVFNSADIGVAKPDVRAFEHVLDSLGVEGAEVFFTDDQAANLTAAEKLSVRTHRFRGVPDLRTALTNAGVAVAPPIR